jgi:hypothetical protein
MLPADPRETRRRDLTAIHRAQGRDPCSRPRHPFPSGHQGPAQGDAAGGRQAGHPVRGGGGGGRWHRRHPHHHRPLQAVDRGPLRPPVRAGVLPRREGQARRTRRRDRPGHAGRHPLRAPGRAARVGPRRLGGGQARGRSPLRRAAGRRVHGRGLHAALGHDAHLRRVRQLRPRIAGGGARRHQALRQCQARADRRRLGADPRHRGETGPRRRPLEPGGHGPLRVHPGDLRQARTGDTFKGGRFDTGTIPAYLETIVELALARPDLGPAFATFLVDVCRREGLTGAL